MAFIILSCSKSSLANGYAYTSKFCMVHFCHILCKGCMFSAFSCTSISVLVCFSLVLRSDISHFYCRWIERENARPSKRRFY